MVHKLMVLVLVLAVMLGGPVFASGSAEIVDEGDTSALERTPEDPRLVNPGQLTVGTGTPVYPPWMLHDDPYTGEGFESAMIYALAEELGFDRDQVV